ncbi:MAG: ABC transporter ATP-binding protein [Polyangiales bacterium]
MPVRFSLTFLIFLIVNGSLSVYQYLVGRAIHDVERGVAVVRLADGTLDYHVALRWGLWLAGFQLARSVLQYVGAIASLHTGQELLYRLRDAILVQVQRLDLGYHLRHGVGEIVARTTRDADKVRDALISFWRNVIETALVIVASLVTLAFYDVRLALLPALLTLVGIHIFTRQADRLVVLDRAVGDAYDAVSQDLVEGVGGVRVIKSFSLERARIERFDGAVGVFAGHAASAIRYAASRIPLPQILVAFGQIWVFWIGVQLVADGRLNKGELVAATMAMNTLIFRFEGIGRVIQIFADARSSAGRIMDFLDAEPAITPGHDELPKGPLGFTLEGVTVRAGAHGAVLDQLELSVPAGETLALVGATGSGKSTLAALLPRLLDASAGRVLIGNQDVRTLQLRNLRSRVHVASQDCFLFSDTVAENLRLARPNASDAELRQALHIACAEDIVDNLPEGLATRLGDRGVTLSGGQRQRLALARAVLSAPAILVLDDSTSALDAVTEQTILHRIRAHAQETRQRPTLLLVASKPSTVRFADRIAVLEHGRIGALGTHTELTRSSRSYRELLGIREDGHSR